MIKNTIIVFIALIFVGCAALGVNGKPAFDPNYSCTEATLKAYRHMAVYNYEYRFVIGFRYDLIGEWQVYDVYITKYKDMISMYSPLIYGKEAEKYFLAEEMYHNKGYDADIQIGQDSNDDYTVVYSFYVVYRENSDKEWKRHTF